MAEIRTVTALRRKREEIRRTIIAYEERLSQAKADLAHVSAAITIFEAASDGNAPMAYIDVHRLFARREIMDLAKAALAEHGPQNTRELARHVMAAKGLDTGDRVLAHAIALRLIHSLRQQERRGNIADAGKHRNVRVWALPSQADPVLPLPDGNRSDAR
jgi:hypothetical protein